MWGWCWGLVWYTHTLIRYYIVIRKAMNRDETELMTGGPRSRSRVPFPSGTWIVHSSTTRDWECRRPGHFCSLHPLHRFHPRLIHSVRQTILHLQLGSPFDRGQDRLGRSRRLGRIQEPLRHAARRIVATPNPGTKQAAPPVVAAVHTLDLAVGIAIVIRQARLGVSVPGRVVGDDAEGRVSGF